MKVIAKNLEDGHVWLDCLASVKEVAQAFEKAHIRFANQMGLRPEPGKSVAQVAEAQLGIKDLDSIVKDTVVEYFGPFAVEKRGIVPMIPAKPEPMGPLQRGSEFAFRMLVLPKMSFELSSYEPLELQVPRVPVDESQVQELIDEVTDRFTSLVTSDDTTPVKIGDTLLLKMEATLGGNPFPGMTFARRPYVTGQGYMPEGFEENLIGMEIGQEKTFSFDAPSFNDQGENIMDVMACTVTVLEKQVPERPELTDEWVKRFIPGYSTAAEFRKAVEEEIEAERQSQQRDILQSAATEALANRFEGKIPDEVYASLAAAARENMKAAALREGKDPDEYIKEMGGEQQATMMLLLEVRQNMTQNLALDAVYKHEKLSYKDEDINAVCAMMNPENPEAVRKELEAMGQSYLLKESAERLVAVNWVVDHAIVTYED